MSSFAFSGTTSAGAATLPNSQSVGRFVDGSLGGSPIQSIADIKDARATNPGSVSTQNPLDVTLFKSLNLPLTGALQLPGLLGITLGAANQVAVAHPDGYSYGASGAVANSGGASIGGNNNSYPDSATIHLNPSAIAGNTSSAGNLLGGVDVTLGAVAALAKTPAGAGAPGSTSYVIAGAKIVAGSPALGSLLNPIITQVTGVVSKLTSASKTVKACDPSQLVTKFPLLGGTIVLDVTNASLTIDLGALLTLLKLDINHLPANTDLLDLLINYVADHGLTDGLTSVVDTLTSELTTLLNGCVAGLTGLSALSGLLTIITSVKNALDPVLSKLGDSLNKALGNNALKPIVDLLKKVVDIGVNVQPNGPSGTYTDALKATPAQNTPVVPGQTVVRAIEVNLLNKGINLALANAAAGPSAPAVTPTTSAPPTGPTNVPTGVPAGFGTKGGTPVLPLILLLVGLLVAGGGVTAQRLRVRRDH